MDSIIDAKQLINGLKPYNKTVLHVHHTYMPSHKDFDGNNHLELQDGMRRYHIDVKGWLDIGQHATLMPDGLFVTGRNFEYQPASSHGYNKLDVFMVEMLGDFTTGRDKLEGPQLKSICDLSREFNEILFHRDMADTECPGSGIDKEWFMSQVKKKTADEIIEEVTTNPDEWKALINTFELLAGSGNVGDLEIAKYFDDLIVKIYYSR